MTKIKDLQVTAIPSSEKTTDFYTFGTVDICNAFSELKTYEIGDRVLYGGQKYQFYKHHEPGYFSSTEVTSVTAVPHTTKNDLSFITEGLDRFDFDVRKPSDFNVNTQYYVGDIVTYSNKFYSFTSNHLGAWGAGDVKEVKFLFSPGKTDKYDTFTVHVTSDDAGFIIKDVEIYANSEDGVKKYKGRTDSTGTCNLLIDRDRIFCIEAQKFDGWNSTYLHRNKFYTSFRSHYNDITFNFKKCSDENVILNLRTQYADGSGIASQKIYAFSNDMETYSVSSTNASGDFPLEFPKNIDLQVFFPNILGFDATSNITTNTVSDRDKTIACSYSHNIKYVVGETAASLSDGTAWKEFSIEDFPFENNGSYNASNHPCVLIHVMTDTLLGKRYEAQGRHTDGGFYVRPADLTTNRGSDISTNRYWSNVTGTLHANVTTSVKVEDLDSFKGITMTDYMASDSSGMSSNSPAADFVKGVTFTHNGVVKNGFLGTKCQMDFLLGPYTFVYAALRKFGYNNPNYRTTYWWVSTQQNASNAYGWHGSQYWSTYGKRSNLCTLPLFPD